jgi:alpha-D-xyloside xylohydrolase
MNRLKICVSIFVLLILVGCSQQGAVTKLDDGVEILVQDNASVKRIRARVYAPDIIRITASAKDNFSKDSSLVVLPPKDKFSDWNFEEKNDTVIVSTSTLRALISMRTGAVVFTDSTGKVLLEELKEGGKFFAPKTVENSNLYEIRQVFESPDNEAFYGLGQHQHGVMNYKGKDVDLAQHNIDIAIPFVYSSRNYGLLWDNASPTKFGDPRNYEEISGLQLYDKSGKQGGFSAEYFVKDKVVETKTDILINFEFLETPTWDSLSKDVLNSGKIVWEGSISSDKVGLHKFLLYASGYFKLWVDGELVFDKWRQNWNPWTNPFEVNVTKSGELHSIKLEWIPEGGFLALKHLDPQSVKDQNRLSLSSMAANEIDYYFIRGNSADQVIKGYRQLTGKATMLPKWAMGFWQSRERYKTQDEIISTIQEFRKRKIPLDNIVLDWFYWPENAWGSHRFDSTRFADPQGMVNKIHELNANIMISVWPKFYTGTDNFNELQKKGFLYQRNLEKKRVDWVGPGYNNTFYDAFNKEARDLYWKQMDTRLNTFGFDAWWMDASEPDMHSNLTLEERILNMSPTAAGPGMQFFNAYPQVHASGVYENQRKTNPERRVFILTRSGFAGQQRYAAAVWSGDIVSRWSDMKDQVSAGVNYSMSGLPYWTMDIGGFALEKRYEKPDAKNLEEWRELNMRWHQFGAFCPLFRVHGQFPFREAFNIAPESHDAYKSMVYYTKLRYRLMPYIYSLAGKTWYDDYSLMRGLVMDFPNDLNVRSINDQFMFGPSLLINPVYTYKARERNVYLPAGTVWYDLYTGTSFSGGKTIQAAASATRIPVFVPAGAILPLGQEMQFTNEFPDSVITLRVYAGKNGSFELYEDESTNYEYEKGVYSTIRISYDDSEKSLTIGERKGKYKGLLENRVFQIILVSPEKPSGIDQSSSPIKIQYNGKMITQKLL